MLPGYDWIWLDLSIDVYGLIDLNGCSWMWLDLPGPLGHHMHCWTWLVLGHSPLMGKAGLSWTRLGMAEAGWLVNAGWLWLGLAAFVH